MFDPYVAGKFRSRLTLPLGTHAIKDKAAIVGIGATDFSKESGRSELQLACEAIMAAVDDAGIRTEDIDGMVRFTMDCTDEMHIADSLGIPHLNYFAECGYGGGASCATVAHAAAAVAAGVADCVVCYRAMNERSGAMRYGRASGVAAVTSAGRDSHGFVMPYGHCTPPAWVAMFATRYIHEFEATAEDFSWVSVVLRENACMNPKAIFFGKPLTLEECLDAKMIAEPLRLYDCCVDTDGAVAIIVTSAEKARKLKQVPAIILGVAQGTATDGESMTSYYRPEISRLPESWYTGQELWHATGAIPSDVDVVQFYDAFSPLIPMQLEEYGFCEKGRGAGFVRGGDRIRFDGDVPCNTSGGHLSEAYLHGMNLIAEGVRQIRGTSTAQVENAQLSLVTGGLGVPTSAVLLRR